MVALQPSRPSEKPYCPITTTRHNDQCGSVETNWKNFDPDTSIVSKPKWVLIITMGTLITCAFIILTIRDMIEGRSKLTLDYRGAKILTRSPVVDGHNNLPYWIRLWISNDLKMINLSEDLTQNPIWVNDPYLHTDIPRLRKGCVGAQFWVAYTGCPSRGEDTFGLAMDQIDLIWRLSKFYPKDLQFARSVADIESSISNGKIASLIGVEGGHSIQSSFAILRSLYALGVRYMGLANDCNSPGVPDTLFEAENETFRGDVGLSEFGVRVVREMNRLGMIVDLSHASRRSMEKVLNLSMAPVIFSHGSRVLCNQEKNLQDILLEKIKMTKSVVMVGFNPEVIRGGGQNVTLKDVVDHIDYIRNVTGPDHVGIGAGYDGVSPAPEGLEDVSKYPNLIKALIETGRWSDEDLEKLTGKNLLRVFREVENVRDSLQNAIPEQDSRSPGELPGQTVSYGEMEGVKAED